MQAPVPHDDHMFELFLSPLVLPAVGACIKLGIFEIIAKEPGRTFDQLLDATKVPYRALNALLPIVTVRRYIDVRGGKYYITDLARSFLLQQSSYYWGGMLTSYLDDRLMSYIEADKTKTERPGTVAWKSFNQDEEKSRQRTLAFHNHSVPASIGVATHHDWSTSRNILDVAGGSGCYSIHVAERHPHLKATVCDLPNVIKVTEELMKKSEARDRLGVTSFDMMKSEWPQGYDTHFMSNIFHDWDDDLNLDLAERSFRSLPTGGKLLLHEMLLSDDKSGPLIAAGFNLHMYVYTEGKQYTLPELEVLLKKAGFSRVTATQTWCDFFVITAEKL
ncbi:O-methyltransferase [Planoprotostelium fungivorum]|uniref:O-methyltransferase n=1 Tax=Planoprotostelium fungivorum TaxID=1890364 RepID=A0A2P6N0H2_9EUKA|nr:O-methyltransferase [Planoprotostelium fungivorum]